MSHSRSLYKSEAPREADIVAAHAGTVQHVNSHGTRALQHHQALQQPVGGLSRKLQGPGAGPQSSSVRKYAYERVKERVDHWHSSEQVHERAQHALHAQQREDNEVSPSQRFNTQLQDDAGKASLRDVRDIVGGKKSVGLAQSGTYRLKLEPVPSSPCCNIREFTTLLHELS